MRYVVCIITDDGGITTLATKHHLTQAKEAADSEQLKMPTHQVKVLERTITGYRVAYVARRGEG